MRSYHGKLRNKIFLFMALVGIIPLVIAAATTYYAVVNAHRDDVAKLESAVITEKASEIQNFIDQDILSYTRVDFPAGGNVFSPSSVSAQQYVLTQTLSSVPFLQSESYVDLEGQETARADITHLGGYSGSDLRDVSASPAFQTAKNGNYYIGPVSYPGNVPTVAFASPVKSGVQTIGVISGVATLGSLQDILASSTIGATGYLYLVDQDGTVIAGGGGSAAAGGDFADEIGGSAMIASSSSPIVRDVLAGNSALDPAAQERYKNIFGREVVAAGAPLNEGGQLWALVAEWPTSEADAVIDALLVRDVIILLAVFVLVIILSAILALIIVRPIKKLEEGTARVAQGKFNEGVAIATGDELQELGDSFNDMVQGLKQLEQLKDEFVFVAAHELRTPVAAMRGYLSLILEGQTGGVNDATKNFIEKVIGSNERLITLVNDLLEVARSQAGRLTIKVAPIDLTPPIAASLDELKSLADEKSITLSYAGKLSDGSDVPKVLADTDRVKEVVVNLVGNAIKYMGGAGSITVTHERVEATADAASAMTAAQPLMIITHIADTGLGISKEAQEKLFQKFYRVTTDKTQGIVGTGLGLFIVKEIIEKMNGTISIKSEEGKGSTFSFSLPIAP